MIVETDGWETHRTRQAFRDDRAKDAALTASGYRVLRFTTDDEPDLAARAPARPPAYRRNPPSEWITCPVTQPASSEHTRPPATRRPRGARAAHGEARQLPRFPMGRIGRPEDAASLVAWLCSEEAGWVTGQVIHSEGGFLR